MTRLAVCVNWPYDMVPWSFWASLWNSDVRAERDMILLRPVTPVPVMGGNMAVNVARDAGCDEILFLDVDQDVPRDVLARFRAHDKDIVGALTALRSYPHVWSMFDFGEDGKRINRKPTEKLQRVDVTGNGCMLVKMKVFDGISKPYFVNEVNEDGTAITASSDFYFFRKTKAAGFELYIDTTVESPHHTDLMLNCQSLGRQVQYMEISDTTREEACVQT